MAAKRATKDMENTEMARASIIYRYVLLCILGRHVLSSKQ